MKRGTSELVISTRTQFQYTPEQFRRWLRDRFAALPGLDERSEKSHVFWIERKVGRDPSV
jgi:hypothetical protein